MAAMTSHVNSSTNLRVFNQPRFQATQRRESQVPARRRSYKVPDQASPSDIGEFHQELNQTSFGCRLLQQLSPVSNLLYIQFGGSMPSLSSSSSPEGMGLAVAVIVLPQGAQFR
jgi:hypothetical protein